MPTLPNLPRGLIIETQHKTIPWRWMILFTLFGVPGLIANFAKDNFVFSLRQFTDSPALISLISSLDIVFNILLGTTCLYLSDRIWTRMGRRLPFILVAMILMSFCFLLIPMAGSLWGIVPLIVLYYAVADIGQVGTLLGMEIFPPHMRGRAAALARLVSQIVQLVFALMITSRFDDVIELRGSFFVGSELMYWFSAGALLVGALCMAVFVRERKPVVEKPSEKTEPTTKSNGFFGPVAEAIKVLVTERSMWPVYLLAFVVIAGQASEGPIGQLLFTEQWGFSKQDIGTSIFIGGLINIVMFPILGWVVDRFDRIKVLGVGLLGLLAAKAGYVVFVVWILPDHRPALHEAIVFGYMMSLFSSLITICSEPLIWDYVPRDKMGAAAGGLLVVRSLSRFVIMNFVGLWVAGYAKIFLPPGMNDYFSSYYMIILLAFVGVGLYVSFVSRVRRGLIKPVGRAGFEEVST